MKSSHGKVEKDLISHLMNARDENGNLFSDKEIADNVILLMDSGHDTSSSTMMMLMKYLVKTPNCYDESSKVWWTTRSTHNDPQYFPNPEKFDPERFDRDTITPHSFVPFGGGPRMCPGKEFARVEILVFLHNLVNNFRWELVFPDELISVDPMPASPKGLPVYLYPHSNEPPSLS
ncbi:hypothetical protein Syun_002721 [Stephania yunnanensis]|uniref:Cytochrome P450 n=1 Tax=Stephania yunnanensis TaxID=152371 RepID=A0AAP0LGA4_9MAGN